MINQLVVFCLFFMSMSSMTMQQNRGFNGFRDQETRRIEAHAALLVIHESEGLPKEEQHALLVALGTNTPEVVVDLFKFTGNSTYLTLVQKALPASQKHRFPDILVFDTKISHALSYKQFKEDEQKLIRLSPALQNERAQAGFRYEQMLAGWRPITHYTELDE